MAYSKRSFYSKKSSKPAPEPGSLYRPVATPSAEQQTIFDTALNSKDNLMIEAFAGCGKTTTCVETMHRILIKSPRISQTYIIFAKRNQEEAISKCPKSVTCQTAHAFGLRAISAVHGKIIVDKEKNERIATALVGIEEEKSELRYMLAKAMDLAKDYLATTTEEIDTVVDKHGLDTCGMEISEFTTKVLEGMELAAQQPNVVSFSDMTWLPIKLNLRIQTADEVYADECQDLNKARFELVFRAAARGRLIAVGDGFQSIFGFSGADRHALTNLIQRSNARKLPLHKTFRCAKAIVRMAQQFVPNFVAADSNPEGEVREVTAMELNNAERGAGPGDFILSRTNAPLMKHAMQFLKEGRRCNIQGRDLGQNMLYMIKRSKAKDVVAFQKWLEDWAQAEIERLTAKKRDVEHILDKKECFDAMCEGRRNLDEVKQYIRELFDDKDDDESRIILSTIHKAKGLERNRVWLLEKSFVVKPKTEEEQEQERNVRYVAITRAKNSLFLVHS
jgi:superfamily I DNA/RNA helicase